MEYQDIVTAYKKDCLEIADLKQKLEESKNLKGREKYRALKISDESANFYTRTLDILRIPETQKNIEIFEKELDNELNLYYERIISYIKSCKAWELMKLVPKEHTVDEFKKLKLSEKVKRVLDINRKYFNFLEYQKIADIRECLRTTDKFSETTIKKLCFLKSMFNNFKNQNIKREFFCFDPQFLKILIEFKKSKILRLEDFIKTKSKSIQDDYKKYSHFFSTEDYRDISDNLILTSKTLKQPVGEIIEAFYELSESEAENGYIDSEYTTLNELKNKYSKFNSLKIKTEPVKVIESEKIIKKSITEVNKEEKISKEIKPIVKRDTRKKAKEQVNPIIFSWLEREDITLTRRVTSKKLTAFFDKIKKIEAETGVRASLFLITNSGKEVTQKRVQEFQKKARNQGLPNLFEGAFGGYGTFRVDCKGNIVDIATMSDENRKKIIKLLENNLSNTYLPSDIIDQTETNYLRYLISNKKDKLITSNYIKIMANKLSKEEKIKSQPIKIIPFVEGKYSGLDVLLKSQLEGIMKVPAYYKSKYCVAPGRTIKINIESIDEFIGDII